MLRQGQREHGSYGLVFKIGDDILCDKFLICYPSQLNGKNNFNGTRTSFPYRLDHRKNEVTKGCEGSRKIFCGEEKNKIKCSTGQPGSFLWHGIMLTTEYLYQESIISTKISLSFTNKEYHLKNITKFNIEFGRKKDIFTRLVYPTDEGNKYIQINIHEELILFSPLKLTDNQLKNEYLSKVDKGVYLNKYAGLWTLGMDLLPSRAQRYLHLFVSRGCYCAVKAWFKTPIPTDPLIQVREIQIPPEYKKKQHVISTKECSKRFTNNKEYSLGNIKNGEKLVEFKLVTSLKGLFAKIELFDDNNNILLKIDFNAKLLEFHEFGDQLFQVEEFKDKILTKEKNITIKILLNKYFIITKLEINDEEYFHKFLPAPWWKIKLLGKEFETFNLRINGYLITYTPIFVRTVNKDDYTLEGVMDYIKKMPYSFNIDEFIEGNSSFEFSCIINNNAKGFYIKLLKDVEQINKYVGKTIFGLEVNFTKNKIVTYTDFNITNSTKNTIFKNGHPFVCKISLNKFEDSTNISVIVNGVYLKKNEIKTDLPIWMINLISIGGDIQLIDYNEDLGQPRPPPFYKFKKQIEMQSSKFFICFEANIPKATAMKQRNGFEINLLHDTNEFYKDFGATVLQLKFTFDLDLKVPLNKGREGKGQEERRINQTVKGKINPERKKIIQEQIEGNRSNSRSTSNKSHAQVEQKIQEKYTSNSLLYINSFAHNNTKQQENEKVHRNPIGQTGVSIVVIIVAKENLFQISINGGKEKITYNSTFPHWAITGSITDVVFGDDNKAKRCKKLKPFIPENSFKIPRKLIKEDKIMIFGEIINPNSSVSIDFLYGAFKFNKQVGATMLNMNISINCTCLNSFVGGKWLKNNTGQCNGTKEHCMNHQNLPVGQEIMLNIYLINETTIRSVIITEESMIDFFYNLPMHFSLIQYVSATNFNFTKTILIE